jgi:hypothetical protein
MSATSALTKIVKTTAIPPNASTGAAKEEGKPERDRGECVPKVVDQVGQSATLNTRT